MECSQCTYINPPNINFCEVCNLNLRKRPIIDNNITKYRRLDEVTSSLHSQDSFIYIPDEVSTLIISEFESLKENENTFICPRCTFIYNDSTAISCEVCNEIFPNSLKKSSNDMKLSSKLKNVTCFRCNNLGHYANQCPNSISASTVTTIADNILEKDNINDYFQSIVSINNIIELINDKLLNETLNNTNKSLKKTYKLCSELPFISQKGLEGYNYSCGYRNIQMLCNSLMINDEKYRKILFFGSLNIPDINGIQSWIEKAWKDGFDPDVRVFVCLYCIVFCFVIVFSHLIV